MTLTASPLRLFTVADLAVFPDLLPSGQVRYELDDGVLVVLPPPTDAHGCCLAKIISSLCVAAEEQRNLGRIRGSVAVVLRRNPDRVVVPDAAFILTRSLPARCSPEDYLETIPEIVVEVRSKNDTTNEVRAKKEEHFAAGVLLVWVLDPDEKTVTAHRPDGQPQVFGTADVLTADDLLPGVGIPVARLFEGE